MECEVRGEEEEVLSSNRGLEVKESEDSWEGVVRFF